MYNRSAQKEQTGFTIVELLIVIVVIAILAAITIVAYSGIQHRAHNAAVQSDLSQNAKKLEQWKVLNGTYPQTRTEFRDAGLSFTLESHRFVVYCRVGDSSPQYALVSRVSGSPDAYFISSDSELQEYAGVFSTQSQVCEDVGIELPDTALWLKTTSDWSNWVVY